MRAARAAWGAPAGGSAGVAGAHKFTEGGYFLFPFRRVSRLRRPFVLRPAASPCRTGRPAAICARRIAGAAAPTTDFGSVSVWVWKRLGSPAELNTFLLLVSPLQCLGTPVDLWSLLVHVGSKASSSAVKSLPDSS